MEIIDITEWPADEEFLEAYPEGARPKRTAFSTSSPEQSYIRPDWRHMFKRSSGRYPEQFWAEIIAHKIAMMLGINAPPCYPAYDGGIEKYGALSPWFYEDGVEDFFSAGNFFTRFIENFDRDKGTQHNLITAMNFNSTVLGGSSSHEFWLMMMYDSIIGNTDRHQDNWGHIVQAKRLSRSVAQRQRRTHNYKWRFCPWFDNGTSLGHEMQPTRFTKWSVKDLDLYIRRGQHHIRHSLEDLSRVKHIESIEIIRTLPTRKDAFTRLARFRDSELGDFLQEIVDLKVSAGGNLTQARADFMLKLTARRVQLSMDILK